MAPSSPGGAFAVPGLPAHYAIERELGRGGSAVVYLARDVVEDVRVAIKVIRSSHIDDAETVARLEREAKILARIEHPGIIGLLSTHRLDDGRLALITAYVEGRTLRELIREGGPLPTRLVERVLLDVAAALEHTSLHGIVHRDIKPENILIAEDGRALLFDFGIARNGRSSTTTIAGAALGTPAYMSPEQIDGSALDVRSDLYSLGMTAYEMLTGRRPWEGENLYTVIYRQKHAELPSLRELRPDVPVHLIHVIGGMLLKHRVARWSSAAEMRSQLEQGMAAAERDDRAALPAGAAAAIVSPDSPTLRFVRPVALAKTIGTPAPAAVAPRKDAATTRFAHVAKPARKSAGRRRLAIAAGLVAVLAASGVTVAMIVDRNAPELAAPSPDNVAETADGASAPAVPQANADSVADTSAAQPSGIPARMSISAGADQRGVAGDVLAAPIVVIVETESGEPVANARVVFRVTTGGGNVAPAEAITDSRGRAAAAWALGPAAGPNELAAAVRDAEQATARFSAMGITGPPAAIVAIEEDTRAENASTQRVSFRVQDRNGNPVAGARVSFRVTTGGGTVEPASMTSQQDGIVRTRWLLGPDTANRITATITGTDLGTDFAPAPFRLTARPSIAAGGTHTCALAQSGAARCWGGSDQGQLGSGRTVRQDGQVRVLAATPFARIAAGITHTCALDGSGSASCWGLNSNGQLGTGDRNTRASPTTVRGASRLAGIAAGLAHTCAVTDSGAALCWGAGVNGQIGDGSTVDRTSPTEVAGGHTFATLTAGWRHTCGLTPQNAAWCWGANNDGQLGDGTTTARATPVRAGGTLRFSSISAGAAHTCGVTTDGATYCWGQNTHGQAGAARPTSADPAPVATQVGFASVAAGAVHTCALTRAGDAYCWGRNNFGQLGNETTTDSAEPVRVAGDLRFVSITASGSHTCGRTAAGQDYCWGYNVEAQLGDGTRTNRNRPVRVTSSG